MPIFLGFAELGVGSWEIGADMAKVGQLVSPNGLCVNSAGIPTSDPRAAISDYWIGTPGAW